MVAGVMSHEPDLVIDQIYAFLAKGPKGEGVLAYQIVNSGEQVMFPLVGSDLETIQRLIPIADLVSQASGLPYRIYKFSTKEDVTDELRAKVGA